MVKLANISLFEGLQRRVVKNSWKDWFGVTGLKERNRELKAFERHKNKVASMLDDMRVLARDMSGEHHGNKIERLQRLFDKAQDDVVLDHIERELADLSMAFTMDL